MLHHAPVLCEDSIARLLTTLNSSYHYYLRIPLSPLQQANQIQNIVLYFLTSVFFT